MITKTEIETKAAEFDIHIANVERDYVFGWLLCGIYTVSDLKDVLILKGGNAFRKAYFASTRFSNDLDFSTETEVDADQLHRQLDIVCEFVQAMSGVVFEKDKNRVDNKPSVDKETRSFQGRLYFKDFYGNPDTITISVRLDIKEFDQIFLPTQVRSLIHPYSDAASCIADMRCLKLEEMLASKLKCLLQRRHSVDLYDYVYAVFINNELAVDRGEIVSTFLRKTIFERSPGVARGLLLALPGQLFKAAWNRYLVCPRSSRIDFDNAFAQFTLNIQELFGETVAPHIARLFYPAEMRNLILDAGSEMRLMSLTYNGITRVVEPYSLVYKHRQDGHAEEYFYVWDQTGGRRSPAGIKTLFNTKIQDLQILDTKFEPRFPVELSKAGEPAVHGYFSRPSFDRPMSALKTSRLSRRRAVTYVIQCRYCGRKFKRLRKQLHLNEHQDGYGNRCHGRFGNLVDTIYP